MTTHIYTVNNTSERDKLVKGIIDALLKEPSSEFTVNAAKVNTIQVIHNASKLVIRTYTVLILPVAINITSLTSFTGYVHYHLDESIQSLQKLLDKLYTMQGKHYVRGSNHNVEALQQALRELA